MTHAMRVLHVIPSVSAKRGGPSAAIMPMLRALRERGVQAEIVTTNDDGPTVSDYPLNQFFDVDGVPVRFFHRFSPRLSIVREYGYAQNFRSWFRQHARGYELIHVHALFSYLSTTAMTCARRCRIPYVSRPLGQLGAWPMAQSRWRKKFYLGIAEAANLTHADAVHFTSESERSEAFTLGLDLRGTVISHGVELPGMVPRAGERLREKLGLAKENKIVLYLGRLHPKKGIEHLVSAFSGLNPGRQTLVLAGNIDPPYESQLKSVVANSGMGNQIIWTGFVSGLEKQLLLQGADVFALTSFHENFGLSVLESLAAGTPVLVSNQVALAGEIRQHSLGEVVPLRAEAIRTGLHRILENLDRWEPGRLRKFVAESYSWAANAVALRELYESILARKSDR